MYTLLSTHMIWHYEALEFESDSDSMSKKECSDGEKIDVVMSLSCNSPILKESKPFDGNLNIYR